MTLSHCFFVSHAHADYLYKQNPLTVIHLHFERWRNVGAKGHNTEGGTFLLYRMSYSSSQLIKFFEAEETPPENEKKKKSFLLVWVQ